MEPTVWGGTPAGVRLSKKGADDRMLDLMARRRSVRRFTDEEVSDTELEALVGAGLLAPSAKNRRPVELFVARDRGTVARLAGCRDAGGDALRTAPLAFAVTADPAVSDVWEEDASIAATQIFLEAEALGLGCCWIQIRRRPSGDGTAEGAVRRLLDVPDRLSVLCLLAIGRKDEEKEPYDVAKLDRSKVHYC